LAIAPKYYIVVQHFALELQLAFDNGCWHMPEHDLACLHPPQLIENCCMIQGLLRREWWDQGTILSLGPGSLGCRPDMNILPST